MIWLFYSIFEFFVWHAQFRHALIGSNPVLQMGISVMNDTLWLPLAIALPIYCVFLIRKVFQRLLLRDSSIFLFIIGWIILASNIYVLFRMFFILVAIFIILWIVHIKQTRTISLHMCFFAMALLGVVIHYNSQLVPTFGKKNASNVSVMSFNVNTKTAFDDERTIQFIRYRVPDIVFLQEVSHSEQKFISNSLHDLYPHILSPARGYGKNDVMILSRYKIKYGDQVPLHTANNKNFHSINHAVIDINGQSVHLLNCHLYHAFKDLRAFLATPDSSGLYDALKASYDEHQEQAKVMADYAASLDGPLIVAGDFNDTPNSLIYARFARHYQNAFAAAGWGLGTTFGEWSMRETLPLFLRGFAFDVLRIDHIFCSREFVIKSASVEKISAFDHHPQIIHISLK